MTYPSETLYPSESLYPSEGTPRRAASVKTPHFAFPFERDGRGRVNQVEQDTPEHVMSCEAVIASCPVGFRTERPDFGIPWEEYRQVVDPGEIEAAMRLLEPRSNLTASEIRDLADPATSRVTIEVEV